MITSKPLFLLALKGRNSLAQSNALGDTKKPTSPDRAKYGRNGYTVPQYRPFRACCAANAKPRALPTGLYTSLKKPIKRWDSNQNSNKKTPQKDWRGTATEKELKTIPAVCICPVGATDNRQAIHCLFPMRRTIQSRRDDWKQGKYHQNALIVERDLSSRWD